MSRHCLPLALASFIFASPVVAADPMIQPGSEEWSATYTPDYSTPTEIPRGSELRNGLFDLLREKGNPTHKFAGSLKAYRNWAIFVGETVDADGVTVHYQPMGNSDTVGLWLRTRDGWVVVDYSFGHSDVFYLIWIEQYGMPRELLGM